MRYWIFYGTFAAARLFFFSVCCLSAVWLLTMLKDKRTKNGVTKLMPSLPEVSAVVIPEVQRRGNRTVYIASLSLMVGLGLGYESRDLQMRIRTNTLYNLTILSQPAEKEFYIRTQNEEIHTVFCEPVPFKAGDHIKKLKYENRTYCWSVEDHKLGYQYAKGDEHHGWNTNADPDTYAYAKTNPYTTR